MSSGGARMGPRGLGCGVRTRAFTGECVCCARMLAACAGPGYAHSRTAQRATRPTLYQRARPAARVGEPNEWEPDE